MKLLCDGCYGVTIKKIGSFTHELFGHSIIIHNVPYYECEKCGSQYYVDEHKVDIILRDAYREKLSETEYIN